MRSLKKSIKQYRKIKDVYFECRTADSSKFFIEINEAKEKKIKYRVIEGQLYIEAKATEKE